MKFDHNFTQTTATPTGRTYAADGWQAQLDFLSGSCLRGKIENDEDKKWTSRIGNIPSQNRLQNRLLLICVLVTVIYKQRAKS